MSEQKETARDISPLAVNEASEKVKKVTPSNEINEMNKLKNEMIKLIENSGLSYRAADEVLRITKIELKNSMGYGNAKFHTF